MSGARWASSASSTAIVGAIVCFAAPTFAQATNVDAGELFRQGRQALAAKDYVTACARFEASQALERAVGTLLSLADCEEPQGKIAAARQHLLDAADWADAVNDPLKRAPGARARAAALDKRVPRLTVKLAADAPSDCRVTRDGVVMPAATLGAPFPVDPGVHAIVVSATGRAEARFTIELREAEAKSIDVRAGAALPPVDSRPSIAPTVTTEQASTRRPNTTIALVTGGVGVALLGVGAFFGASASSSWSSAKRDCVPGACGEGSRAQSERDDALHAATGSTVAFALGAAALVGAVILYFTAPSPDPRRAANVRVAF